MPAFEQPRFRPITHPDLGRHRYNGFPWRFAGVHIAPYLPPPRLGEHSRALLTERLGIADSELDRLTRDDLIGMVIAKAHPPAPDQQPASALRSPL